MKKTPKPKVCDCCSEIDELHWNKDYGWICDLCKADIEEKDAMRCYEREESLKYMLDEGADEE